MGKISIFLYPLTLAVYRFHMEKEVKSKLCFQRGVLGVYLLAVTLNSVLHV